MNRLAQIAQLKIADPHSSLRARVKLHGDLIRRSEWRSACVASAAAVCRCSGILELVKHCWLHRSVVSKDPHPPALDPTRRRVADRIRQPAMIQQHQMLFEPAQQLVRVW